MGCLPSAGATATTSSISPATGASAVRTVSFKQKLISGPFHPSIFCVFFSKIILMCW